MSELWPWLALIGLGAFHGFNPAMGWLFAVALGQHRRSRRVVLVSLVPIAIGHAVAIAVALIAVLSIGTVLDLGVVRLSAGLLLIGWAIYHALYRHRHRVRFGISTGMTGLAVWSFLMASAHGAGFMLVPIVIPLTLAASPAHELTAGGSLSLSLAAVAVHTLAMLAVTGTVAVAVYEWLGLAFLRRGWVNVDLLWTIALFGAGGILVFS